MRFKASFEFAEALTKKISHRKRVSVCIICVRVSYPIIRQLDTPVNSKTVQDISSKPSCVDFDAVIDKPSKQESPCSSKTKNCPVIK